MTVTEAEINAAKQAGRDAVYKADACVNWEYNYDEPLGIAWAAGWNEENAKLTEADCVKFTHEEDIVRVISDTDDRGQDRRYRGEALYMVLCLAGEYGWKHALHDICRQCSGGGRKADPECA